MEQIIINISGRDAEAKMGKIMQAVHKTLARMDGGLGHVSVSSQRLEAPEGVGEEELLIPRFMANPRAMPPVGRIRIAERM